MTSDPFIPPRTRDEIQNPAPEAQRHEQALRIAMSFTRTRVSTQLPCSRNYAALQRRYERQRA